MKTQGSAGIASVLTFFSVALSNNVYSNNCVASGESHEDALARYAQQCVVAVQDCDPVQGRWYCSSGNIDDTSIAEISLPAQQVNSSPAQVMTVTAAPSLSTTCVDPDGDGWGWDGNGSCRVESTNTLATLPSSAAVTTPLASCIDGDGDGWGWDGNGSCRVESTNTLATPPSSAAVTTPLASCIDDNGDGWGWNGTASCQVNSLTDRINVSTNPSQVQTIIDQGTSEQQSRDQTPLNCSGSYSPSDITDVVLVTGQSNVTGAQTEVSATLDQYNRVVQFHNPDRSHPRVFAWTVDGQNNNNGTGWQVAALNQSWHDASPGIGGIARNSFAFHFAKQVATRTDCRVIGIITVSEGGRGISHWDNNATGWIEINRHVNDAISAIGRSSIDAVLWHQGESDWIADGTCFTGGTCNNNLPDYYAQKLYSKIADPNIPNTIGRNALIDRLRNQNWFADGRPFIAGETIKAPVNVHLNKLNSDGDRWTATVRGDAASNIGIRADDPFQNHYNADGLREMGSRYATEYINMTAQ